MAVETTELVLKSNVKDVASRDKAALDALNAANERVKASTEALATATKPVAKPLTDAQKYKALENSVKAAEKAVRDLNKEQERAQRTRDKQSANDAKAAQRESDKQSAASAKEAATAQRAIDKQAEAAATRRQKAQAAADDRSVKAASKAADKLPRSLQPGAGKFNATAFQQVVGFGSKLLGPKATGQLVEGASKLSDAWDKAGPAGQALIKGGATLGAGAVALAAAVAVLGAIAVGKILAAVAGASIEATDRKTKAVAGLGKNGSELYKSAVKLSVDLDLDLDQTLKETKGLITTGFKEEQVPVIIEAVADIRIAKGDDAANALQKGLEKVRAKGKFGTDSVDGLAEAGIRSELVYKALAKSTGQSFAIVQAKVKAGQIDVEKGIDAILSAAKQQGGGAAKKASNTVDGILGGLKIQASTLFDDVDTGPLKEFLSIVSEMLSGTEGDNLKKSVTELGNALFSVFKTANSPEGRKAISEAFEKAASAASDAAVVVRAFDSGLDRLGKNGGFAALGVLAEGLLAPLRQAADLVKLIDKIKGGDGTVGGDGAPPVAASLDVSGAANDTGAAGVGANMSKGVAQGVSDNAGAIADSMSAAVNAAVKAAEAALGIASPSKRLAITGKWSALGMAKGWTDNAGAVADAAAGTAGAAANAAAAPTGTGASPGGAGSAPASVSISVTVQGGSGSPSEIGAAVAESIEPAVRRALRSIQRDGGESGSGLSRRVA